MLFAAAEPKIRSQERRVCQAGLEAALSRVAEGALHQTLPAMEVSRLSLFLALSLLSRSRHLVCLFVICLCSPEGA
jgi:hypothetical protein